jgi:hypothetical protein
VCLRPEPAPSPDLNGHTPGVAPSAVGQGECNPGGKLEKLSRQTAAGSGRWAGPT